MTKMTPTTDQLERARALADTLRPLSFPAWLALIATALAAERARAIEAERDVIANRARDIAGHYPRSSDGRNTFILLAEWIEARALADSPAPPATEAGHADPA